MKRYRIFYAGRPQDAVLLDAERPADAAYAFFANQPERNSIFVTIDGGFRDWTFGIDELARQFPDVPSILEHLAGEKDVLKATLVNERQMEKAPEIEVAWIRGLLWRFVLIGAGVLIAAGFALYQTIKNEGDIRPVTCGEFSTVLPHGWSIYRDIVTPNGVHLVKFEDKRHTLLNLYVFAKNTGASPQEQLESFAADVVPRLEATGARVTVGEVRPNTTFGLPGVTRRFTIELKGKKTPHTWQVVRVPFESHDLNALVQYPDWDRLDAESGAAKVIASVVSAPTALVN